MRASGSWPAMYTTITIPQGDGQWVKPGTDAISAGVPSTKSLATSQSGAANFQWLPDGELVTDPVIVFLDDCEYERTDSKTGEKTVRKRKSGEILWHDRGEDAPVLKNLGAKPYRSLLIELKDRL